MNWDTSIVLEQIFKVLGHEFLEHPSKQRFYGFLNCHRAMKHSSSCRHSFLNTNPCCFDDSAVESSLAPMSIQFYWDQMKATIIWWFIAFSHSWIEPTSATQIQCYCSCTFTQVCPTKWALSVSVVYIPIFIFAHAAYANVIMYSLIFLHFHSIL